MLGTVSFRYGSAKNAQISEYDGCRLYWQPISVIRCIAELQISSAPRISYMLNIADHMIKVVKLIKTK